MFVVKIDIWPHGDETRAFNQTTIAACNDGTGTPERGNYQAIIVPNGDSACDADVRCALVASVQAGQTAKVRDFPRGHDQHHLPALAAEIIEALGCREFLAA